MPAPDQDAAEPNGKRRLQKIASRNRVFRVLCHDNNKIERVIGNHSWLYGNVLPKMRLCVYKRGYIFMDQPESKSTTEKVLVSAHQIGCILGALISDMRKSTGAYIRILGKDQTPQYATANEQVVQINADNDAVKEALMQITTCLRNQYFQDQDYGLPYMGRREHSPPGRYPLFNRFDGGDYPSHRRRHHCHRPMATATKEVHGAH